MENTLTESPAFRFLYRRWKPLAAAACALAALFGLLLLLPPVQEGLLGLLASLKGRAPGHPDRYRELMSSAGFCALGLGLLVLDFIWADERAFAIQLKVLTFLVPLGLFIVFMVWLVRYGSYLTDSDTASELIIAKVLSRQGKLFTKDMYYSTALRVVNQQIIFAPLFWVFSSWYTVKVVGIALHLVVLCASAVLVARAVGLSWRYCSLLCSCLMLPMSKMYLYMSMYGLWYSCYASTILLTVGVVLYCMKEQGSLKVYIYYALICLLALLNGFEGIRMLFLLYVPFFIASLFLFCAGTGGRAGGKRLLSYSGRGGEGDMMIGALLLLLASGIGYVVNAGILSRIYSFRTWASEEYTKFSLDKLLVMVNGFLDNIGLTTERPLISEALFRNGVCFTLTGGMVLSVRHVLKKDGFSFAQKALSVFFVTALAFFALVTSFASMGVSGGYILPIMPILFIVILQAVQDMRKSRLVKFLLAAFFVVFTTCGTASYNFYKTDLNADRRLIVRAALEQGCQAGYASYWNADVMTELSDGRLDMYSWTDTIFTKPGQDLDDVDDIYPWLQEVRHSTERPQGKVFCAFESGEMGRPLPSRLSRAGATVLYQSDRYTAFVFDSYEELKRQGAK